MQSAITSKKQKKSHSKFLNKVTNMKNFLPKFVTDKKGMRFLAMCFCTYLLD